MRYILPQRKWYDAPELLEKLGLDCYDIWDIMIATKRTCRDNFRVALCEKEHPV